jgi:hypothetical protein
MVIPVHGAAVCGCVEGRISSVGNNAIDCAVHCSPIVPVNQVRARTPAESKYPKGSSPIVLADAQRLEGSPRPAYYGRLVLLFVVMGRSASVGTGFQSRVGASRAVVRVPGIFDSED